MFSSITNTELLLYYSLWKRVYIITLGYTSSELENDYGTYILLQAINGIWQLCFTLFWCFLNLFESHEWETVWNVWLLEIKLAIQEMKGFWAKGNIKLKFIRLQNLSASDQYVTNVISNTWKRQLVNYLFYSLPRVQR